MFDTQFHDTDKLINSLPQALVDHRELNAVAEAVQSTVQTSSTLQNYALNLWKASAAPADFGVQLPDVDTARLMLAGASPRGMSMLLRAARVAAWLQGRGYVTPEDVQAVFVDVLAHRLCFQPVYELRRQDISAPLMAGILAQVAAP
jgi:MoxR-like ATPase